MKKTFSITKVSKIYLYGAASIGKIIFENLTKQGYRVEGFIDKRAEELSFFLNRPVISIDDVRDLPEDTVIVVAVKNVFEHDKIARILLQGNAKNIIFKAKSVLENRASGEEIRIGNIYDAFLEGEEIDLCDITQTNTVSGYYYKDYAIKSLEEKECIALIPVPFIYTNNYELATNKWGNVNLYAFFTHDEFFGFLGGNKEANPEYYVNEYCVYTALKQQDISITPQWRQNVVRNRAMIYEQMNLTLDLDKDFFFRNVATAEWNCDKKYFNLTSGKHRCMFLVSKGYRFLPLKISKEDYDTFCNIIQYEKLKNLLEEKDMDSMEDMINHPYFYKFTGTGMAYMYRAMHKLTNYFAKEIYTREQRVDFEKLSIKDNFICHRCFGRHFAKMGAKVYREELSECEIQINELEQVTINKFKPSETNVYFVSDKEEAMEILNKLGKEIYVVLESSFEIEQQDGMEITLLTKGYVNEKVQYMYVIRTR